MPEATRLILRNKLSFKLVAISNAFVPRSIKDIFKIFFVCLEVSVSEMS